MNPNNPLVNRLFETRKPGTAGSMGNIGKKRLNDSKEEISNRDKVLVPKLIPKNNSNSELRVNNNTAKEKQKSIIIRPPMKLPPLSEK